MNIGFKEKKMADLARICRERGVPLTNQRRLTMEALASRCDHPSADDIYEAVHQTLPAISRTTVYRVLDAFVAMGIVRRISGQEARARFDADTGRHHHVQCVECGTVADCRDPAMDALPLPATVPTGFRILDYSISYTGLCAVCIEGRGENGQPERDR